MGLIGVLKSLNVDNLSNAEKADLKKKLLAHKKELKERNQGRRWTPQKIDGQEET